MANAKAMLRLVAVIWVATLTAYSQQPSSTAPAQSIEPSAQSDARPGTGSEQESKTVPAGSRVFVAKMEGGFETYVIAGLQKKNVPVVVVADRDKADFEISGVSESEKAGWAKMLFMGSQQSREQSSIKVVNIKTGIVVFAYSVNKGNSYRGKQSAGEACAKHIKEKIEGKQN
ncbi:MAG: hypothetical protein LAN63_18945 [Acidobacteriia bacterium]|nr:hypothetical protein [Terriglobia bacterium]